MRRLRILKLERVVEQIIDAPMPQILQEIVEFEEFVDIPVLQIELFFLVVTLSFFGAVVWSVAHCFFLNSLHLD